MKQMVCSVCSYTYDEAKGIPEAGIAPGTKWEELPENWKCPWCGAGKEAFREKKDEGQTVTQEKLEKPHVEKELSAMEMSIICSNLSRGCEKQYLQDQADAFKKLADFFKSKAEPVEEANVQKLLDLIETDLTVGYPYGNSVSSEKPDRGALRCQPWRSGINRPVIILTRDIEKDYQIQKIDGKLTVLSFPIQPEVLRNAVKQYLM